jgi:hypothetical protein
MKNFKTLSKAEMRNVVGSGSCCIHNASWGESHCGMSRGQAEGGAGAGQLWCCDSCHASREAALMAAH